MAKTALILGGTKGLGLSLSWEAHNRQVRPIIAGRSTGDTVNETFPPSYDFLRLDLSDPESVEQQFARRSVGPVDYVFWVAGNFHRQALDKMPPEWIESMVGTHLSGPVRALELIHFQLHYSLKHPYHLVTIASTSYWRIRDNESLYCALKAAKAAFTRNLALELGRDLPGSKTTLINPGGMRTALFDGTGQDVSKFMDPDDVAKIIWDEVESQQSLFKEVQIMRDSNGDPSVSYGPRTPELPSDRY